jgi:hypothetical protein
MGRSTRMFRRTSALGVALTAYDVWRRLPPKHRRMILANAKKHGPRLAKAAAAATTGRTRR